MNFKLGDYAGFKDANGQAILLGSYYQSLKSRFLTYQIRVREGVFVVHTGGSYSVLDEDRAKELVPIEKGNAAHLGIGADLFHSDLVR